MTKAAITADVHQPFDIHLHTLSEIALDLALSVDDRADLIKLVLTEVTDLCVNANGRFIQDRGRARFANAVNVGQAYLRSLVWW